MNTTDTLLIDFDYINHSKWYKHDSTRIRKVLGILYEYGNVKAKSAWVSKTARGIHIQITLADPIPLYAAICIQSAMGSDPLRETFSISRMLTGRDDKNVNVLFKRKVSAAHGLQSEETYFGQWTDELNCIIKLINDTHTRRGSWLTRYYRKSFPQSSSEETHLQDGVKY